MATYTFTDQGGQERVIEGDAAFKAYLLDGGLAFLQSKTGGAAKYRYALVYRPAGIGATPAEGFLRVDPAPAGIASVARHGVAVYSRELTEQELKSFELRRVHTESERAAAVEAIAQHFAGHKYAANYYEYVQEGDAAMLEMVMRQEIEQQYPFDAFSDADTMPKEAGERFATLMKAKQPEPERGMFERKWPLSVQEAKDQELIESFYNSRLDKTQWRVGVDQRVFETGSEALDYYYTVVKPRDEELDKKFESEEARQRIADVAAGKTMPAYREGDNAQYVEPDGQVKHITMRQYRQRVFDLEKETGKPNVFAKTKAEFDESVKVMPLAQPAASADPERAKAVQYLQGIVDGTTDPLTVDFDNLEALHANYGSDPEVAALFEKAADVVANAALAATA